MVGAFNARTFGIAASLFLGAAAHAHAAPIVITSIDGPSQIFAGETATFNVVLGLTATPGLTSETLTDLTLTIDSGEGETQSGLSGTFFFGTPGLYTITAQGSAETTGVRTVVVPIVETYEEQIPQYDGNGNLIGYTTVIRTRVSYRTDITQVIQTNLLFGTTQVEVIQATIIDPGGPPAAVPEPSSVLLLGTGAAAVIAGRRRRREP